MKKLMIIAAAVAMTASAPASAGWYDQGLWAGEQGCQNNIPSKNRWFYLLFC